MTDARSTQEAAETWASPSAAARSTQVAAEVWAYVTSGSSLGVATLVALEQWANVLPVVRPGGNTAVSVNTS